MGEKDDGGTGGLGQSEGIEEAGHKRSIIKSSCVSCSYGRLPGRNPRQLPFAIVNDWLYLSCFKAFPNLHPRMNNHLLDGSPGFPLHQK